MAKSGNMRGLEGRVAMVTGGGGGIGRAIAARLAEEGCTVGVLDIDAAGADETVEAIGDAGGAGHALEADIADLAAVERAVADLETAAGPIDVLVNNAGWDRLGRFLDTRPELWRKIVDINLWGPLHMHHAVASRMAARGRGRIVNIASDAGRVGSSGEAVYAACKGGVIAFSKSLARELAGKQININVVCPGPTETALFDAFLEEGDYGRKVHEALARAIPFRRLGQPDDIAGIVAFLASDDASFITGQVISVSGGLTMHG
ncbi:MAG TPA: glucose 1-dehydrogenase [Aestuariivirgaceae bacterium]|nr:glucose 1-dehydrogenase [Aestuariivirgaceae bacterium]